MGSCSKAALTAPTGSTLNLTTNTTIVPLNGTAQITAQVFAAGNIPVHNGTVVDFQTTIGTLSPSEARTNNGKCTVLFYPGNTSGKATVRAFSGGINSGDLALTIGAAAISRITLSASSSSVPSSGGTVSIFAIVVDADGNQVVGVPVVFTTTAGTVDPTTVTTDSNGRATTTLTTRSTAQVTATSGTVSSNALTITAAARPSVSVSASSASPAIGQAVTFTVTVTPASGTTGAAINRVNIDFGDGQSQLLGTTGGSVSHTYGATGTYNVTVDATDANGETGSATTVIIVNPVTLGLTPTPNSGAAPLAVSFTLTVNPTTATVQSVDWDFGDGGTAPGTVQLTIGHTYISGSTTFTAKATVHFVGGSTLTAQTDVRVQ